MTAPVSVLMPVHNAQQYVERAVRSILEQTFPDFELIVVDDGSTDSSLRILQAFAANDTRMRVISRENTGIVGALNEGLRWATGKYLARMDADDISRPERFAEQITYMEAHPECVAFGCQVLRIDPAGRPIGPESHPLTDDEILQKLLRGFGGTIPHPGVMMRLDAVRQVGGYRSRYEWMEDLDLYLSLAEIGELANHPDILLEYRYQFGSVNMLRRELQMKVLRACLREHCRRLRVPYRDPEQMIEWLARDLDPKQLRHQWARRALACGHWRTVRAHAGWNVLRRPWDYADWRLFILGLFERESFR